MRSIYHSSNWSMLIVLGSLDSRPETAGVYQSSCDMWKMLWFRIIFGRSNLVGFLLMTLLTVYGAARL